MSHEDERDGVRRVGAGHAHTSSRRPKGRRTETLTLGSQEVPT